MTNQPDLTEVIAAATKALEEEMIYDGITTADMAEACVRAAFAPIAEQVARAIEATMHPGCGCGDYCRPAEEIAETVRALRVEEMK